MDRCLSLTPFKIPRPRIYSHQEVAAIGQQKDAARVTKARDRYGNIPLVFAKIQKTKQTLGLAIEGGANTKQPLPRVLNIQPTGSAVDCEALQIGHVILEVNGRSLVGVEHKDAARLIAEAFVNKTVTFMELLVTEETTKLNDIIKNTSRL